MNLFEVNETLGTRKCPDNKVLGDNTCNSVYIVNFIIQVTTDRTIYEEHSPDKEWKRCCNGD